MPPARLTETSRIVVAGEPRCGKTRFAELLRESGGFPVRGADELVKLDWLSQAAELEVWLAAPGPWIIEGLFVINALKTWLKAHAAGAPCDVVYWMDATKIARTGTQAALGRGARAIWVEIEPALRARGVQISREP